MTLPMRLAIALLIWLGSAAAGWWWHRPGDAPRTASAVSTTPLPVAIDNVAPLPEAMANRVAAADPMGLNRVPPGAPNGAVAAPPGVDNFVWRLAALVVRGAERYAVLTASGKPPLQLKVGETLPDGDRIKAIHADRIAIQSPRGRLRTLTLIEP